MRTILNITCTGRINRRDLPNEIADGDVLSRFQLFRQVFESFSPFVFSKYFWKKLSSVFLPSHITCSTFSRCFMFPPTNYKVFSRKLVPIFAYLFSCINSRKANPTKNIISSRKNSKMFWIKACSCSAFVVYCFAIWNLIKKVFIGKSMNKFSHLFSISSKCTNCYITIYHWLAWINPTRFLVFIQRKLINVLVEVNIYLSTPRVISHLKIFISVPSKLLVVLITQLQNTKSVIISTANSLAFHIKSPFLGLCHKLCFASTTEVIV